MDIINIMIFNILYILISSASILDSSASMLDSSASILDSSASSSMLQWISCRLGADWDWMWIAFGF